MILFVNVVETISACGVICQMQEKASLKQWKKFSAVDTGPTRRTKGRSNEKKSYLSTLDLKEQRLELRRPGTMSIRWKPRNKSQFNTTILFLTVIFSYKSFYSLLETTWIWIAPGAELHCAQIQLRVRNEKKKSSSSSSNDRIHLVREINCSASVPRLIVQWCSWFDKMRHICNMHSNL